MGTTGSGESGHITWWWRAGAGSGGGGGVYKYSGGAPPRRHGGGPDWRGGLPLTQATPPLARPPTQNILTREHINTVCERHRPTNRRGSPVCFPTCDPTLQQVTAVLVITFDLLFVFFSSSIAIFFSLPFFVTFLPCNTFLSPHIFAIPLAIQKSWG